MQLADPATGDFEARVRDSFARQNAMRFIGADAGEATASTRSSVR